MSKRVAFDLDDTLLDFKELASRAITKHTGIDIHWTQWHTYALDEVYGESLTTEDFIRIWHAENVIENAPIKPHALELINECIDQGLQVSIITARMWHSEGEQITLEWLEQNQIKHNELILTSHGQSKVESIPHSDDFLFVVDDHIDHCRAFAKSGRFEKVYLKHAPWNENETIQNEVIQRTHCLSDIKKKLRGD